MRQTIRLNTFETNSSSYHTLIIMSKDEFEKFKNGELYFAPHQDRIFMTDKDIPEIDEFKIDNKDYENLSEKELTAAIDVFKDEYFDTDYALGYSYDYLDSCTETVYDKEGNEKVAVSIYIGDC